MCKVDILLSPLPNFPGAIRRMKRSMPMRQIQYNSDVLREVARMRNCSVGDIIPIVSSGAPLKTLHSSYRRNVTPRQTAREILKKLR